MKVKAKPGVLVPREENPRRYVPDNAVLDVPESAYYLRRIADGDLLRDEAGPAKIPALPVKNQVTEPAAAPGKNEPESPSVDNGAK